MCARVLYERGYWHESGTCFFFPSASQSSGTIETQDPFLCTTNVAKLQRDILLCQRNVRLHNSYQILNGKAAPRAESMMAVNSIKVNLTEYRFQRCKPWSCGDGVGEAKMILKPFFFVFAFPLSFPQTILRKCITIRLLLWQCLQNTVGMGALNKLMAQMRNACSKRGAYCIGFAK